jgi:putative hydrolase of the HAD superfamily
VTFVAVYFPFRAGGGADRTIGSIAISTVVFDWYATLATPNPDDWWPRLGDMIRAAGGTPLPAVLSHWEDGHPVDHPEHSASEAAYRAWQRDRLATVLVACDVAEPARTELLDQIDRLRYTRVFDVYDDVVPTLAALRERGVTVGLCSNWDWDLDRHLTRTGIGDLLDRVG